jgi:MoxR-like ATPase
MDQAVTKVIIAKANEFLAALSAGRLEWTSKDLASFFLESKKVAEKVTVPEHGLGPIDEARAALVAKVVAALLGAGVESTREGFQFTIPEGAKAQLPTVVEKIVEKIIKVEVPVEKKAGAVDPGEVPLKYPPAPGKGHANSKYQSPSWYKRMEAALDAGKHVSLAGPPGTGKSTGPEQYFIRRGQPFVVVNGDAGFRRKDIEGTTEIQGGLTFFNVAEFAAAAINGWGCILNEVNAADPDALMWINGILEVPNKVTVHGRTFEVHKDFRLVVTYNPGLVGTKALPQAFKDRFFPIKLGFPPKEFVRRIVVAKTGVSGTVSYMDRLLKYAQDCWTLHEKGTLRYQISPRRLFDVVFLMEAHIATDLDTAIKQAILDAVDSHADQQALTQLITKPLQEIEVRPQFG